MSEATASAPHCLLTGARGYVGGLVSRRLQTLGWRVTALTRSPSKEGDVSFALGECVPPKALEGAAVLVHCAYDFRLSEWDQIRRINVDGSNLLFEAASAAGVPRLVVISTISAFDGCRSKYGRAKLMIEDAAAAHGGCILRPGLIYGPSPGAMFGRLVSQVRASRFVPVPGDGKQKQFLLHEDDLTEAVHRASLRADVSAKPITIAHETPHTFREIIDAIGRKLGRDVVAVPTPSQALWLALRAAEIARLPTRLRSDSLVSLLHQNPAPLFNSEVELGVRCRPFNLDGCAL